MGAVKIASTMQREIERSNENPLIQVSMPNCNKSCTKIALMICTFTGPLKSLGICFIPLKAEDGGIGTEVLRRWKEGNIVGMVRRNVIKPQIW